MLTTASEANWLWSVCPEEDLVSFSEAWAFGDQRARPIEKEKDAVHGAASNYCTLLKTHAGLPTVCSSEPLCVCVCPSTFSPATAKAEEGRVAGPCQPMHACLKCAAGVCVSCVALSLRQVKLHGIDILCLVCLLLPRMLRLAGNLSWPAGLQMQMQRGEYNVSRWWLCYRAPYRVSVSPKRLYRVSFRPRKETRGFFLGLSIRHGLTDVLIACGCTFSWWEQAKTHRSGGCRPCLNLHWVYLDDAQRYGKRSIGW